MATKAIDKNFWWDQKIYANTRRFATTCAVSAPFVALWLFVTFIKAKDSLIFTWTNPFSYPVLLTTLSLNTVTWGLYEKLFWICPNCVSVLVLLTIFMWGGKKIKRWITRCICPSTLTEVPKAGL